MITTTTTQDVQMHGWTLPAGSTVDVYEIVHDGITGSHFVSCYAEMGNWNLGLPTWAVDIPNLWQSGLPIRTDY